LAAFGGAGMNLISPEVMTWIQAAFLGFFLAINGYYLTLNLIAAVVARRLQLAHAMAPPAPTGELAPPISVLVPAYNEAETIVASVQSLLQQRYAEFEIVAINDGSSDATRDRLIAAFSMREVPVAPRAQLPSAPIRAVYRSPLHANLVLVDKENGGKADALNAGINVARTPLFCAVDADSILQHDSLRRIARPFFLDRRTIVVGGSVRLANGCRVSGGYLEAIGTPRNRLARMQVVEYLRAFLFGRLGWNPMNAVLIVSGAFGLFRRAEVVAAGGYRKATIGEDMELILRLHRLARDERRPYRIVFVPDPFCWTEAPEDLKTLRTQRRRWQQGLMESLWANRRLLLHPRGGAAGWLAFPAMLVFEALGPVVEVAGYALMTAGWLAGAMPGHVFFAFMIAAIGLGMAVSASALLLEQLTFRQYPRTADLWALVRAVMLESLGFRQLTTLWRLEGLLRWLRGRPGQWGEMKRTAKWQGSGP
jgi:cellulose synthase/poly-beta-1,6-N-acetylglucosamine synthase-like glycosyltransferase